MPQSFSATVGKWAAKVDGALEAVFRESAQELVSQMQELLTDLVYKQPEAKSGYKRTGFLRASLVASKTAMPGLVRANPGGSFPADVGEVLLVINDAEIGETIYLGYTARYGAFVHFGSNGQPPRPWVDMIAQRWISIVEAKAAEIKARLGL